MSKTRTILRIISTEKTEDKIIYHCEKVLQGKKWWMLKWRDCYTCLEEHDGFGYYPITSCKNDDDERWKMLLDDDKYVWAFFHWFPVKL